MKVLAYKVSEADKHFATNYMSVEDFKMCVGGWAYRICGSSQDAESEDYDSLIDMNIYTTKAKAIAAGKEHIKGE